MAKEAEQGGFKAVEVKEEECAHFHMVTNALFHLSKKEKKNKSFHLFSPPLFPFFPCLARSRYARRLFFAKAFILPSFPPLFFAFSPSAGVKICGKSRRGKGRDGRRIHPAAQMRRDRREGRRERRKFTNKIEKRKVVKKFHLSS